MSAGSSNELAPLTLDSACITELQQALERVETGRGVLVRLADLMGGAVGQAAMLGMRTLGLAPALQARLQSAAETAISRAFNIAVIGMDRPYDVPATPGGGVTWRDPAVRAAVTVSGAVGGFTGLPGLVADVGFTTLTIMREIARIAREQGEDLSQEDARAACLEVFALRAFPFGGKARGPGEDSELGYFSARAMLRGRPVIMLVSEVATHYGLGLSRKFALQMMPVAGALCGASLNAAFLSHYRAVAQAHFTIRRLEREFGPEVRRTAADLKAHAAAQARED
ncbi:EcsC family protein [Komagataeibacter kakiaceti JCM 25156]